MLEIYYAEAEENLLVPQYLSLVTEYRRNRIEKLIKLSDKAQSLAAELLLRFALSERGLALEYRLDAHGKPHLPFSTGLYFSLSHTDGWAAAALADVPVGVDVQKRCHVSGSVAPRAFTAADLGVLRALPPERREGGFFELWTRRESLAKALGCGIAILPDFVDGYMTRSIPAPPDCFAAVSVFGTAVIPVPRTIDLRAACE